MINPSDQDPFLHVPADEQDIALLTSCTDMVVADLPPLIQQRYELETKVGAIVMMTHLEPLITEGTEEGEQPVSFIETASAELFRFGFEGDSIDEVLPLISVTLDADMEHPMLYADDHMPAEMLVEDAEAVLTSIFGCYGARLTAHERYLADYLVRYPRVALLEQDINWTSFEQLPDGSNTFSVLKSTVDNNAVGEACVREAQFDHGDTVVTVSTGQLEEVYGLDAFSDVYRVELRREHPSGSVIDSLIIDMRGQAHYQDYTGREDAGPLPSKKVTEEFTVVLLDKLLAPET